MQAVIFDSELRYVQDWPCPRPAADQALIRVHLAGICKTDLEIIKGYMGFQGVLGHEFVGIVQDCQDQSWIGQRVAGEINLACGYCSWCLQELGRHCPHRKTLGIADHDGCMAEYCLLPLQNLHAVEEDITDQKAVLIEPLAAACEILEQLSLNGTEKVIVLGDGRLGILCAWALSTLVQDITLVGHHPEKLKLASWKGLKTSLREQGLSPGADVVVEATGSGQGISRAMALCRPRGTIVLKSTVALQGNINLAPLVINELTVVGSRCGRFQDALHMLRAFPEMPLESLITHCYPIHQALAAFAAVRSGQALKVVLDIS